MVASLHLIIVRTHKALKGCEEPDTICCDVQDGLLTSCLGILTA
jgi:hypothetical protein